EYKVSYPFYWVSWISSGISRDWGRNFQPICNFRLEKHSESILSLYSPFCSELQLLLRRRNIVCSLHPLYVIPIRHLQHMEDSDSICLPVNQVIRIDNLHVSTPHEVLPMAVVFQCA